VPVHVPGGEAAGAVGGVLGDLDGVRVLPAAGQHGGESPEGVHEWGGVLAGVLVGQFAEDTHGRAGGRGSLGVPAGAAQPAGPVGEHRRPVALLSARRGNRPGGHGR
jgi:hypothetical protein